MARLAALWQRSALGSCIAILQMWPLVADTARTLPPDANAESDVSFASDFALCWLTMTPSLVDSLNT